MRAFLLLMCLTMPVAVASAQDSPLSGHTKFVYGVMKKMLLRSAEMMPEENYGSTTIVPQ